MYERRGVQKAIPTTIVRRNGRVTRVRARVPELVPLNKTKNAYRDINKKKKHPKSSERHVFELGSCWAPFCDGHISTLALERDPEEVLCDACIQYYRPRCKDCGTRVHSDREIYARRCSECLLRVSRYYLTDEYLWWTIKQKFGDVFLLRLKQYCTAMLENIKAERKLNGQLEDITEDEAEELDPECTADDSRTPGYDDSSSSIRSAVLIIRIYDGRSPKEHNHKRFKEETREAGGSNSADEREPGALLQGPGAVPSH